MRASACLFSFCLAAWVSAANISPASPASRPIPTDQEHTCFQTSKPFSPVGDLGSDVAVVYGIGPSLPERMQSWREHGYHIQVMTGSAWGRYQVYLRGGFDGVNHEDEIQTDRNGRRHGHGGDVFYLCPSTNFGAFLCTGVRRALDAGTEAIYLEEPEFWVRDGYSAGFKREWRNYYHEDWHPPRSSVDAEWRASKLKYFLYRRLLQQVFDYVRDYNQQHGRHVRCYVPTHSLLNYAHWRIVSPESSLARIDGCNGYIAQVWTGTSRTPNMYRGRLRERTFETAFLEYGAMQNLVRATGRTVWYLNDPVEDNPNHDWNDYRRNWESTLTASLFQPGVWHYEVAPWPERVFGGRYPRSAAPEDRKPIPPGYATELQTVFNALNHMKQPRIKWDCGTTGIGVMVSDSLMFERGDPSPSDPHMSHFYGLALPFLKRGMPVAPVQLEGLTIPNYLDGFRILLLTYDGMKPLSPDVHPPLADWVKRGGILIVCDDDEDPYNHVREWWNRDGRHFATPRQDLFQQLGLGTNLAGHAESPATFHPGKGEVIWLRENPAKIADALHGDSQLVRLVKQAATRAGIKWSGKNHLLLRRGPYIIAAGLDESIAGDTRILHGHFVNLFDPTLQVRTRVALDPGSRFFLLDLDAVTGSQPSVLASACRTLPLQRDNQSLSVSAEGVADTPAVVLIKTDKAPKSVTLDGEPMKTFNYSRTERLLWIHFTNESRRRKLTVAF